MITFSNRRRMNHSEVLTLKIIILEWSIILMSYEWVNYLVIVGNITIENNLVQKVSCSSPAVDKSFQHHKQKTIRRVKEMFGNKYFIRPFNYLLKNGLKWVLHKQTKIYFLHLPLGSVGANFENIKNNHQTNITSYY